VSLRGTEDPSDRYANVPLCFWGRRVASIGAALAERVGRVLPVIADGSCSSLLPAGAARGAKRGIWNRAGVIKNTESPDDILTRIGRLTVVESKVLSVRQAGTTTSLNFGRSFTADFAMAIARRMTPVDESAGMSLKSLENRQTRFWVETRSGPRIAALHTGQIELLSGN